MRVTRTWRIWACFAGLIVALTLWGWSASEVLAYPQPSGLAGHDYSAVCPPRPADLAEGATVTEAALVTIAQEQADACARREQLAEQQHADLVGLDKHLTGTLKTTVEGEPLVKLAGEPTVKVGNWESASTGGTVELTAGAKEAVAGDAGALHDDAWYLIGVVFAAALAFLIYFEIRPRP